MSEFRVQHADKLIRRAKVEAKVGNVSLAWKFLESAHIFSQPYAGLHMYVHWEMCLLAYEERNYREVFGQFLRLVLAAPASIFKRYPVGNTGRAEVSMFQPMQIPKHIAKKIRELEKIEREFVAAGGRHKENQRQHPISRR